MTPNEKGLPNFEKLTKALNKKKFPYRSLCTLVLICEPAVKLYEEDSVNLPGPHIVQQLLHDFPLQGWLPGRKTLIPVCAHDLVFLFLSKV